jgi:HSP20 family protein
LVPGSQATNQEVNGMALPVIRRNGEDLGTRWGDPFAEFNRLNQEFNRLAQNVFGQWPTVPFEEIYTPLADIEELDDHYVIEVELPGIRKEDVSVEAQGRRVVIEGERKEREPKGVFRTKTRTARRFHFEAVLPSEIHENNISANLADGILTIRLQKTQAARKKKIEVRSS